MSSSKSNENEFSPLERCIRDVISAIRAAVSTCDDTIAIGIAAAFPILAASVNGNYDTDCAIKAAISAIVATGRVKSLATFHDFGEDGKNAVDQGCAFDEEEMSNNGAPQLLWLDDTPWYQSIDVMKPGGHKDNDTQFTFAGTMSRKGTATDVVADD